MKARTLILASLFCMSGCGVTTLSPDGRTVRQINTERAADCQLLGVREIQFDWSNSDATEVISRDNFVRNVVAEAGGDAYRVAEPTNRADRTRSIELYDCDSS